MNNNVKLYRYSVITNPVISIYLVSTITSTEISSIRIVTYLGEYLQSISYNKLEGKYSLGKYNNNNNEINIQESIKVHTNLNKNYCTV